MWINTYEQIGDFQVFKASLRRKDLLAVRNVITVIVTLRSLVILMMEKNIIA